MDGPWRLVAHFPVVLAVAAILLGAQAQAQEPSAGPVVVAVVDSGIDAGHDEFQGLTIARHSFVAPSVPIQTPLPGLPDPFETLRADPDGQGTAVASLVAGATLGQATAGLVDLQVSGRYTGTDLDPSVESAATQAMDWLLANHGGPGSAGPRIALLSFAARDLSGPGAASVTAQAQALWEQGVLVVVPAGGASALHASPYVVTVAGAGQCQPLTSATVKPDLSAPASATVASARMSPADSPGETRTATGAPYAAAHVAAAAATAWAARSDLPVAALAAILRDTAQVDPDGCATLDVEAVVQAATAWQDPAPREELSKPTPGLGLVALVALLGALGLRGRKSANAT